MPQATSQAIESADGRGDESREAARLSAVRGSPWQTVRDPLFTAAAVGTILACAFGVGPFDRPEGSHETFLAATNPR